MAAIVFPGVRRCLCGIRSGNSNAMMRTFSQLVVHANKRDVRKVDSFTPILFQNYVTNSQFPETNEEEEERLISLLTLKVRSSDEPVLDSYTQFMQSAATHLELNVSEQVYIPMHIEKRTLLKSPHIFKKHQVQFELRTHTRMIQLREVTGDSADIYLEYIQRNIPEGVSMSIEQTELEAIPEYLEEGEEEGEK